MMARLETQTGIIRVSGFTRSQWRALAIAIGAIVIALAFYFDAAAQSWVTAHRTSGGVALMAQVSRWGDWPSHVVLGLVLTCIAYLNGSRRWQRIFVAMLVACALAGAAARVVKLAAGRARPSVQVDAGWNGPRWSEKYHAFPSGHTASSTAFFAVLALASWRRGAGFLVIPVLIAFARMYLGAHHLSDVVCAALLGLAIAWLVCRSALLRVKNPT
jgi:membrane-associated phospholipid phosphatase